MGDSAGNEDWLMGTTAAAAYLHVHRTTVNLAVSRGELVPDALTPRGHYRFSRLTLERYRTRVNRRMGTGKATQAGAAVSQRAQLLARLMRMAAADEGVKRIAQEAVTGIMDIHPDLCMAFACARKEADQSDTYALELLAEKGVPDAVVEQYRLLRHRKGFAVVWVMASGQPEYCPDIADASIMAVRKGTRLLLGSLKVGSYLVLPLMGAEQVIGLLGFASTRTHAFSEVDQQYYTIIADLLACKLHDHRHRERLSQLLRKAGELARGGMFAYTSANTKTLEQRLRELAGAFRDATGAFAVCSDGFLADIRGGDPIVDEMAREARKAPAVAEDDEDEDLPAQMWKSGGRRVTGIHVTIPLIEQRQAGIAAGWNEERTEWPNNRAALHVLAAACALTQARMRLIDGARDPRQ